MNGSCEFGLSPPPPSPGPDRVKCFSIDSHAFLKVMGDSFAIS